MKLLALDTATEACSAAVWADGAVLERYEWAPRRHATLILPMIESVLAEAGLSVTQLDAIAVGRGPGAFTGVRIAVGIAQGIAFAADLPVAPVSTLAALALGAAAAPALALSAPAIISPAARILPREGALPIEAFERTLRVNLLGTYVVLSVGARMMAGLEGTDAARAHAAELLAEASRG